MPLLVSKQGRKASFRRTRRLKRRILIEHLESRQLLADGQSISSASVAYGPMESLWISSVTPPVTGVHEGRFQVSRSNAMPPMAVTYEVRSGPLAVNPTRIPTLHSFVFEEGQETFDVVVPALSELEVRGASSVVIRLAGTDRPSAVQTATNLVVMPVAVAVDHEHKFESEPEMVMMSAPPSTPADALWLKYSVGAHASPITANPIFAGQWFGDFQEPAGRVDFDLNLDGQVDADVALPDIMALFEYDPRDTDPSLATYVGPVSLNYRLVEIGTGEIPHDWQTFTFSLIEPPISDFVVAELSHEVVRGADALVEGQGLVVSGRVIVSDDPYGGDPYGGDPYGGDPYGGDPYGGDPYGGDPYGGAFVMGGGSLDLWDLGLDSNDSAFSISDANGDGHDGIVMLAGGDPYGGDPYGGDPYGGDPYGGDPYGGDPYGGTGPWGDANYGEYGDGPDPGGHWDDPYGGGMELEPGAGGGLVPDFGLNIEEFENLPAAPQSFLIQVDHNGNGTIDGDVITRPDGHFDYRPSGLEAGWHTLYFRAVEWSTTHGMYLHGPWVSYSFHLQPEDAPPITELGLRYDTGESDTDGITADPGLIGVVDNTGVDPVLVVVEFDLNGDGQPDEDVPIDDEGLFHFVESEPTAGPRVVRARTRAFDEVVDAYATSSWTIFTYTYEPLAIPQTTLELFLDDGEFSNDNVTTVDILTGVASPMEGDDIVVQLDLDGDGMVDGVALPQSDGQFLYRPIGLPPGLINAAARVQRVNPYLDSVEVGPWTTLEFTLEEPPPSLLELHDLRLAYDTGSDDTDRVTTNPTLVASVVGDALADRVEIDFDADGIINATSNFRPDGSFRFTPVGLALGEHLVRARAVGFDYQSGASILGEWSYLDFTLVETAAEAPAIATLELLSDSGIPGDLVTANASILGKLSETPALGRVTIQVDTQDNGEVDATLFTDTDGVFLYHPASGQLGSRAYAFRAVVQDFDSGQHLTGDWSPITFTFESQVDEAARLLDLTFHGPDDVRMQPAVSGRVTYQRSVDGIGIEIDIDGDGTPDLITTTDQFARWEAALPGLDPATTSVAVRTRSIASDKQVLIGSWEPLAINFTPLVFVPAAVDSIELVKDDGPNPNDKITSDPRIRGTVDRAPYSNFLTIEIDLSGDGLVDGQALVQPDLTWAFTPTALEPG